MTLRGQSENDCFEKVTRSVVVENPDGLHLRGATQFVEIAQTFTAEIKISHETAERASDGKSILDLLVLGAGCGTEITITARGKDAAAAVERLARCIAELE